MEFHFLGLNAVTVSESFSAIAVFDGFGWWQGILVVFSGKEIFFIKPVLIVL